MGQFKLVWNNNGKQKSNSVSVSIRELTDFGMFDVISPTDIVGVGGCYGTAEDDFARQLDDYISSLVKFRDEVVNTERAFTEAVLTDYAWNPISMR